MRRNPILYLGSIASLLCLVIIIYFTPQQTALLMLLIFLLGASGSAMTVCFGSVRELNRLDSSSTSLGLMNMCVVGSGAIMQPVIGWMLDLNWDGTLAEGARVYAAGDYRIAFSGLLVVNTAALVATLFLRETRCQQQVT